MGEQVTAEAESSESEEKIQEEGTLSHTLKMPRNYIRKTQRQSWCEDNMASAIKDVIDGKMGYKKASITYSVPKSTLKDRIKKVKAGGLSSEEATHKQLGHWTVFTEAQEAELANHIMNLEERLSGLTLTDIRELAFQLAEKNKIPHTFNMEKKRAGKDWLYGFLNRHPKLSLRNRGKNSVARTEGSDRTDVQSFFDLWSPYT